jgi:hypothetical protein
MRLELGIDNMWKLIEQWDHPDMRQVRARTAAALLQDWTRRERVSEGATDILNLFELVAYLVVRSESLRLEDAWTNFSGWALSWWYIYLPAIKKQQETDPTILEDYASLVDKFLDHEVKERHLPREEVIPTEEDLVGFLQGEVKLVERLRYRERIPVRLSRFVENWWRSGSV